MNIKRFSIYLVISSIHLTSCSFFNKPTVLSYDEIFYSEYMIRYGSNNSSNVNLIDQYSGGIFIPITALKLNKNGNINYFRQSLSDRSDNSYFKSNLSASAIQYFNTLIDSIKMDDIDAIYYKEHPGMLYDGSYYYLSFRKDKRIVSSHIFYLNDSSKEIKRFIEFLNYFFKKSKFDSVNRDNLFENDFKQIFESHNRLSPIKVKRDRVFEEYIPSVEELKNN